MSDISDILKGLPTFTFSQQHARTREQSERKDVAWGVRSLEELCLEAELRFTPEGIANGVAVSFEVNEARNVLMRKDDRRHTILQRLNLLRRRR